MLKIVMIGAGNVATHLAQILFKSSFTILQVFSRTEEAADNLAKTVDAIPITVLKDIRTDADIYIFSLKDAILSDILKEVPSNKGIWLHTAGSIPMDIFKDYSSNYGVFYPFQTFSKNRSLEWKNIPIFIEASSANVLQKLEMIGNQISEKVAELSSEQRKYIHLTGVFACNFTNHMYALSEQILKKVDLPFDVARPLIDETASKVHYLKPLDAQTGPAIRYDENVINKHLELMEDERTKKIYKLISESINELNKKQ